MNILEEYSDSEETESNELIISNYIKDEDNTGTVAFLNENIIDKEYESIYTLSKISDIQNNKKIQFIKQMLNFLLKNNFTNIEILIIHSIYNHNKECLEKRNKIFKEYALILIILKKFNISLTPGIINDFFPRMPYKENSKKIQKITTEITYTYNFDTFLEQFNKISVNTLPNKTIPKKIKMYVNGFVFYIKNLFTIKSNYNKIQNLLPAENGISKDEIINFNRILLNKQNVTFCNDENLNLIADWISNIIKNIIIFNTYIFQTDHSLYYIPINKSLEFQIQILINLFIYIILLLHTKKNLEKEKFDEEKIMNFLTINYKNTIIPELIKNRVFYSIMLYIHSKKSKSIFSSRKFFRVLYSYFK